MKKILLTLCVCFSMLVLVACSSDDSMKDYDMSSVSFVNKTVAYTGSEQTITITGTLPEGVTVTYENNKLTEEGFVNAVAKFTGDSKNYNPIAAMQATLTIREEGYDSSKLDIDLANFIFDDKTVEYDGEEHQLFPLYDGQEITSSTTLPEGLNSVSLSANSLSNPGSLVVTATFDVEEGYNCPTAISKTLTITKKEIVIFDEYKMISKEVVQTGEKNKLELDINTEFEFAAYLEYTVMVNGEAEDAEGYASPGTYEYEVTFNVSSDYQNFYSVSKVLTATLVITESDSSELLDVEIINVYDDEDAELLLSSYAVVNGFKEGAFSSSIVIPKYYVDQEGNNYPITQIAANAFENEEIILLTFTSGMELIGDNAFAGSSIITVNIPSTVTTIGSSAFAGCESLSTINFTFNTATEGNLVTLGEEVFANTALTYLSIPSSVTNFGDNIFTGCALTELYAPSLTSIEVQDFTSSKDTLKIVDLSSVQSVPSETFLEFGKLETVNISSALEIGYRAFKLTKLSSIQLSENLNSIGISAFENTMLVTLDLSNCNNLTSISGYTFINSYYLTTVKLPSSITSIGTGAFQDTGLQSIELTGIALQTLNSYAFANTNLTELTIPADVSIPSALVTGSSKLKTIIINTNSTPDVESSITIAGNAFAYDSSETNPITSITFPSNYNNTTINLIINTMENIETVKLPTIITSSGALGGLKYLTTINVEKLETLAAEAFKGCSSLTELNFSSLTQIGTSGNYDDGTQAFAGCENLVSINLGSLTVVPNNTFSNCTSLETVIISTITEIGNYAFEGCTALTTIDLKQTTFIGNYAFVNCTNLLVGNDSLPLVDTIGNFAFENCSSISAVSLSKATSVGNYAFKNCTSLTTVTFTEAADLTCSIGEHAFNGCVNLSTVTLNNVTEINEYAFYNTRINNITLTEKIESIGGSIFDGCASDHVTNVTVWYTSGNTPSGWEGWSKYSVNPETNESSGKIVITYANA